MKRIISKWVCGLITLIVTSMGITAENEVLFNSPEPGTVSKQQGLKSWQRIYEVASHPRCANCHVGKSDRPMWSGPSFTKTQVHGMNIRAGNSRIGAETLLCSTCHMDQNSKNLGGAPGVADIWKLAPVDADWFGQTSDFICQQLRDPQRNGNRSYLELAQHLDHDVILHWAWAPGGNREPAPRSLQDHIDDILAWGVAGMPCPSDNNDDDDQTKDQTIDQAIDQAITVTE